MAFSKNGVETLASENKAGEAPTLAKQRSGNFMEDEGGIWGIGVDGAKCGCSDESQRNCTDNASGDTKCGSGGGCGNFKEHETPALLKQRSGNFVEDEGALGGTGTDGAKCACSDPSQGGEARSADGAGSCGQSCGTCTDGSKTCSTNHHGAANPAAVMSPLSLSEDGDRGKLFFASESGTTKRLAELLLQKLKENGLPFELVDPASYEPEDLPKEKLVIVVASTWEDGKAPKNAAFLAQWLEESSEDFRVGSGILRECRSDITVYPFRKPKLFILSLSLGEERLGEF